MTKKTFIEKITSKEFKRGLFIFCMLVLPILQFLIFFVYVNISTVVMSFQNTKSGTLEFVGFKNYLSVFDKVRDIFLFPDNEHELVYAIRNSLLFGVNDLVLQLVSIIFAYFFYKKIRGSNFFRFVFFFPSIISMVIYMMVYRYMFQTKAIDQMLGFVGIKAPIWLGAESKLYIPLVMFYCLWVGTGYNILIIGGAMGNLPEDVMEYSRLEGVGYVRELFQIVIPMIWATITVGILGSVTVMFTLFMQLDLILAESTYVQATSIAFMINKRVKLGGYFLYEAATLGICFTVIAIPIVVGVRKSLEKIGNHFDA